MCLKVEWRTRTAVDKREMVTRLWIGGSSGLAQTYFNHFEDFKDERKTNTANAVAGNNRAVRWILVGAAPTAPLWMPTCTPTRTFEYYSCDLTKPSSVQTLVNDHLPSSVDQLILAVRPPLVSPLTHAQGFRHAERMVEGLSALLKTLVSRSSKPSLVIHVSSIAAIDHLNRQSLRSESSDPDPPSAALQYPYDWFKRRCEEDVQQICSSSSVPFTNLRLGAIFSDSAGCIQCGALWLQALVGPYLTVPIDCNSSRNISSLIHQLLVRDARIGSLRPVYYYTRPIMLQNPVPYGEYLVAFRKAYGLSSFAVWMPRWSVEMIVYLFHVVTNLFGRFVPYLQSVDYLLQVTTTEHSFDCAAVAKDFGRSIEEESILACFERRRQHSERRKKIR
jgi:nucleoside-diphosphate-sugar epimerase